MRRRLVGAAAAGAITLLSVLPAHAGGAGEIEHVQPEADGTVKVLYSIPAASAGTAPNLDSVRVEFAGKPVKATASPMRAGEIKRVAVLALDVSNSMAGDRFAAAQQAALAYLDAAPADVSVGLVTFAGSVDVVQSPTTDHASVADAVSSLNLSAGTQLYDGVHEAVTQVGSEGLRQVIVLSDGADTGSTPLETVVSGAEQSGATVNVVALEQSPANQAKLRQITDTTGGSVLPADDPAALSTVFAQQAEDLAQQVLIEFRPREGGEASLSVALDANGQTYTDSAFVALAGVASEEMASNGPIPVQATFTFVDERFLMAGAVTFGLGFAVVVGALLLGKPDEKTSFAQRQLAFYSGGAPRDRRSTADATVVPKVSARDSAVAVADQIVKKGGLEERISQRLTAAGLSLTAAEWLLLHAGTVVALALVGFLLSGGNPLTTGLFIVFGVICPWVFLGVKEGRRLKAFNSQLADTLQLMSGGLSAGLSLPQAVDTVVREGSEPMASELRRALVEQRLGVDIEDALEGVAERMQSKDFRWVVMAIRIQREIGGNLAELLNTVAATIREREYLRRQVRTLSAEGRLSAWILGGLPPVFLVYLVLTKPGYIEPMYTTSLGWMLSAAAVVMLGIGVLWLKAVVKVEV